MIEESPTRAEWETKPLKHENTNFEKKKKRKLLQAHNQEIYNKTKTNRVNSLIETIFHTLPSVQTTLQPWKEYKNGVWSVLTMGFHGAPLQVLKTELMLYCSVNAF